MQEIQVRSLGGEDPLEKEIATHSSILTWRIPRTKESASCSPWDPRESNTVEGLTLTLDFPVGSMGRIYPPVQDM